MKLAADKGICNECCNSDVALLVLGDETPLKTELVICLNCLVDALELLSGNYSGATRETTAISTDFSSLFETGKPLIDERS